MKKIISIVLVLVCAFALFSCGEDDKVDVASVITEINDMYNAISPSMVHTEMKQEFGEYTLTSWSTLKIGTVDGYQVAVFESENQQLRDLEGGSGLEVLGVIETVSYKKEYHEEYGVRENNQKWDEDGESFIPETGANALTLTTATIQDFVTDSVNKTYSFKVLAANTEAVFGYAIDSDVDVTIAHSGADIIGVKLVYTVTDENVSKHPEIKVTIEASYSYESQTITIN